MSIFNLSISNKDSTPVEVKKDENTGEVISDQDNTASTNPEIVNKDVKVVLDGPLSKIYGEALNLIYANESFMMQTEDDIDNASSGDKTKNHDLFVYCLDADDIEKDGVVESAEKLRIALDSNSCKKKIVAIESHGTVSNKLGLINEFVSSGGYKVYFMRNSALEAIKGVINGSLK